MQIDINQTAMVIIIVALFILFGPEGIMEFGRDLQKAWRDFVGIFKH